ncbi:MAG: NapC/NirT family cytochrome c, partial [bacterium]
MAPSAVDPKPKPAAFFLQSGIGLSGIGLIFLGVVGSVTFVISGLLMEEAPSYMVLFLVPFLMFVIIGLVLVPIGIWRVRRKRRRGLTTRPIGIVIDFAQRTHRRRAVLALLLLAVTSVAGFTLFTQSFQMMESNTFCGQLCHTVMTPEWTAYQYSSHARVKCVECHIGSGADWFLRSKLSGIRQMYAVSTGTFPRPIPTPIRNLRPARETCEQCHWPKKFAEFKESVRTYYRSDKANTPQRIRILIKTGGEESPLMKGTGIHYHMLIANKVEFIARDRKRQDIAWVRITHKNGPRVEYHDQENPLTPAERKRLEIRIMDCVDCHNRPSHQFPSPMHTVNQALAVGRIDPGLPHIKVEAVRALDSEYPTTQAAMAGIEKKLRDYYREKFPEVLREQANALNRSIAGVQEIYRRTIFPEMKANWAAYPDNIGHRDSPGCFRCHNYEMESEDGDTIFV